MKITKVEYRKLFSLGNYENEVIGAEVAVGPDRDPDAVLLDLKAWVEAKHQNGHYAREQDQEIERRIYNGKMELKDLESDLKRAREKWDAAKTFLAKHGINLEDGDMPF